MSYILAITMGVHACVSMVRHSDWRYWMCSWALCAFFILCGHVGRIVHMIEENKKREAERRIQYIRDHFKKE